LTTTVYSTPSACSVHRRLACPALPCRGGVPDCGEERGSVVGEAHGGEGKAAAARGSSPPTSCRRPRAASVPSDASRGSCSTGRRSCLLSHPSPPLLSRPGEVNGCGDILLICPPCSALLLPLSPPPKTTTATGSTTTARCPLPAATRHCPAPLRPWPAAPSLCSAPRLLSTGEFILHRHLHVGPTVLSHVANRVNDATSDETTSQTTEGICQTTEGGDLVWFSKLKEPIYQGRDLTRDES
jgi:hypothetical protein